MQRDAQQAESRQAKETMIYRMVVGTLCVSLITYGVLGLLDVINTYS
jgi:hypothetical protein